MQMQFPKHFDFSYELQKSSTLWGTWLRKKKEVIFFLLSPVGVLLTISDKTTELEGWSYKSVKSCSIAIWPCWFPSLCPLHMEAGHTCCHLLLCLQNWMKVTPPKAWGECQWLPVSLGSPAVSLVWPSRKIFAGLLQTAVLPGPVWHTVTVAYKNN